jgi:hypothetical protein
MGDAITKWLSRSDDVLKDDRADKTRRIVRRGRSLDDQPDQIRLCTYSLHHYCLRWTTLECQPYTAPSTKEASREVVHNTGTCITQCQRWWTKITNSGTMLCKTSPLRFKTVPEHHKTQEELDTKMFSEFTSLVGMKLTDKEEIKKIKKKPAQP